FLMARLIGPPELHRLSCKVSCIYLCRSPSRCPEAEANLISLPPPMFLMSPDSVMQVQCLEQQNKILTIRWSFLKDQNHSQSESDIKLLYDQYMSRLKQEMRAVSHEREQLESQLTEVLNSMDDIRCRYEGEIHKRSGIEFTFVELKKDLDASSMHKTELEVKLRGLQELMELKKTVYEQELQELLSETKDVSVNLGIDNRCSLDLSRIVEDVRAQYEALALRSWEDAEAATWSKLNEGASHSATYRDHLLSSRREIAELNIRIQKLRSSIVSLESQCLRLEEDIKEAGEHGQRTLQDARAKLAELEEALQKGKADLAHLVKEYRELMNIKLALDVEILTYRKLVEGEESRWVRPPFLLVGKSCCRGSPARARLTPGVGKASLVDPREKLCNGGFYLSIILFIAFS
uniref:Keratin 80 n=1 Tax=Pelusios castaneus TaxID=367368 RepID=A0A8C8VNL9_9SAUR